MNTKLLATLTTAVLLSALPDTALKANTAQPAITAHKAATEQAAIIWTADNFPEVRELLGSPQIIQTVLGPAAEFNGKTDGVFLDSVPVSGMEEFTIEMIFKPSGNADFEQRFMHMGAYSGPRIMFESRVNKDNSWYFDAFVHIGDKSKALIDPTLVHPTDRWYSLALTVGKDGIRSYVDGVLQQEDSLSYRPVISEGVTSLGVRQNKVCWFKGAIFKVRVTPRQLSPAEFLKDQEILNK